MNYKRGFTLIELLVVIAIIGILSSVVLASLNTARDKGANAAAKSNLNGARAQAELYYDGAGGMTYNSVCGTSGISKQFLAAASSTGSTNTLSTSWCAGTTTAWAASVMLKGAEGFYCVDSTGYAGVRSTTSISDSDFVCL